MWVNSEVWLRGLKIHQDDARLQSQGIVGGRSDPIPNDQRSAILPRKKHVHMALESQPSSFSSWSEQMLRHRQTT